MARVKQSITQRDWAFGELREDFLERDDTANYLRSAKKIRNMRILASGALTTRPGLISLAEADGACQMFETTNDASENKMIVPFDGGIKIFNPDGSIDVTLTGLPWDEQGACDIWIKQSGNEVLFGSKTVAPLVLDLLTNTVAPFAFATGENGSTAQPYYNFNPGVTIQPSATSGAITVTASGPVFTPGHVGTIIRYNGQEISVTGYTSPTQISGAVLQNVTPTYEVTVEAGKGSQYAANDAVEGATSGATGIVSSRSIDKLTIIMNDAILAFTVGEYLIGPNTVPAPVLVTDPTPPKITAVTLVNPAPSYSWDEQVFSPMRDWPGSAECHQNRMVFTDIPALPNAYMISKAGSLSDFTVGSKDGDGIFETIAGNRLLYAVSAEDLLLFGEEGVYYIGTRNGDAITPLTQIPRRFSSVGSARVRPVLLNDGVAYLSKCSKKLMGAALAGGVNRYWQDIHLAEYAPHLIRNPTSLGTTEGDSDRSESYLYAVNSDGTLAVMKWQRPPFEETIGWALWETKGKFVRVASAFCKSHAIVERDGKRFIERFDDLTYVDAAKTYASLDDVSGSKAGLSIWANGRYLGAYDQHDISAQCYPDSWGPFQVGCAFEQISDQWPRRIDETTRKGFVKQRNGRVAISVQDSTSYLYANQRRAFYDAFEDLTEPPRLRTEVHRFCSFGRSDHPCHEIRKPEPGPLTILAFSVEVQG